MTKKLTIAVVLLGSLLLSACTLPISRSSQEPPYTGPVAKPQVAYRIDDHRFFEIVPLRAEACSSAGLYFRDTAKNIYSRVMRWEGYYGPNQATRNSTFIIDAANDQFLVGPISRGNLDCQSGGGGCGGSTLPYSTDSGRTWRRVQALSTDNILVTGSIVFSYGASPTHYDYQNRTKGKFLDLSSLESRPPYKWVPLKPRKDPKWSTEDFPVLSEDRPDLIGGMKNMMDSYRRQLAILRDNNAPKIAAAPPPKIAPIDTKFHCYPNGKE